MQRQAALLAEQLTAAGIQPGDIVAVALPRSVRLSLALTAIVQTGAAWLPLDTGYPDERLAYMVADAKPRLIITESALMPVLPRWRRRCGSMRWTTAGANRCSAHRRGTAIIPPTSCIPRALPGGRKGWW